MHAYVDTTTYVQLYFVAGCFINVAIWLKLLVKPGAPAAGRHAWFLIITFVLECMRVSMYVCTPPRP